MRPVLLIGVGNPWMGDDGIGCAVAERLASDPRLPGSVEVICGGTDLLRYGGQMAGRSRVVILDAVQDDAPEGSVVWLDARRLDGHAEHAHHLSAAHAIRLLGMTTPVSFLLMGISISSAAVGAGVSPALAGRMAEIADRVLRELEGL